MFCRKCGEENPDNAVFCRNCGEKLKEETSEEEANALAERIMEAYPDAEVEVHSGNQPIYYYIISVE